jgi:hypothetical protein
MTSMESNKQRERKNLITGLTVGMLALLSFVAFLWKVW